MLPPDGHAQKPSYAILFTPWLTVGLFHVAAPVSRS